MYELDVKVRDVDQSKGKIKVKIVENIKPKAVQVNGRVHFPA